MPKSLFDWLIFLLAAVVYLAGLQLTVMDVDSAQYAAISREMAESGEYLQVFNRGKDYLDKPPLLFWAASLSFEVFGVYNWSFKLIPFVFALFSLFAVYRLGKLLFDARTGKLGAILLGSSQAYFLFTNDLRTDTLLTACVILATWQIMEFLQGDGKRLRVVWGFAFIGLAMLAKGPLGLVVPGLALASHILINRQWRNLFRCEWLLGLLVMASVLAPMSWGLYQQFDLQPDKVVMMPSPEGMQPRSGISGLRFFFWEQSFGRITGENVWKDGSGPFFFVHTFLWSFMPWALLAVVALFWKLITEVQHTWRKGNGEWLLLGGFIIPFLVLSTSQFKLPHYIFPLYPFAALFTAQWLIVWSKSSAAPWKRISLYALAALTLLATAVLLASIGYWIFPQKNPAKWIALCTFLLSFIPLFRMPAKKAIWRTLALGSIGFNLLMNLHFYPLLLHYQKGSAVAELAQDEGATWKSSAYLGDFSYSFDFYMGGAVPVRSQPDQILPHERYIFTDQDGLNMLKSSKKSIAKEVVVPTYPITNLSGDFLDPNRRQQVLRATYLVILEPEA